MSEDNRVKLRCQACGDAENCNFYCELIVVKGIVDSEEIVCPISGDECEWDEVENLEAKRIEGLEDLLGELYDEASYLRAGEWVIENEDLQRRVIQALKGK